MAEYSAILFHFYCPAKGSDSTSLFSEPLCRIFRKKRRKLTIHPFVICIQPCLLLIIQKVRKDCRCIYMAKCHCLEVKPFTELGISGIATKNKILMTDSMQTLPIQGRLIGCQHA